MEGLYKQIGAVTVTTAGTRVQITSSQIYAVSIIIQASSANAGKIYVGTVAVTSANGIELAPGESYAINAESYRGAEVRVLMSDIYLDSANNGDIARVHYIERS